jgi:hypothetical protein
MSSWAVAVSIGAGWATAWFVKERVERWLNGGRAHPLPKNTVNKVSLVTTDDTHEELMNELKNALLTSALALTGRFNDDDVHTEDALPPLSGDSIVTACFSYIDDRYSNVESPGVHTKHWVDKQSAIRTYMKKNFPNRKTTMDFFDEFFWLAATCTASSNEKEV